MSDRSYLVLDVETIPDPELPWDSAREGFPPPSHHQVIMLGALWLDADFRFLRMGVFDERQESNSEAQVLSDFVRFVGRERCHLVTYHGRTFDLPVLVNRCLRHGITFRMYFTEREYRHRYSELGHVDLADVLSEHGAARIPRLESIAATIGIPGKRAVNGAMISHLYTKGQIDLIREGCMEDVVQTTFLFLRYELLRGRLDKEQYRERALSLWDVVASDTRTKGVLEGADREKVLLL